ncbi:hypothetical protein FKM82_007293 [Ascaphus truei]
MYAAHAPRARALWDSLQTSAVLNHDRHASQGSLPTESTPLIAAQDPLLLPASAHAQTLLPIPPSYDNLDSGPQLTRGQICIHNRLCADICTHTGC